MSNPVSDGPSGPAPGGLPGADALVREHLLARLEAAGPAGVPAAELAAGAGRREVERALAALQAEGRAVEVQRRWLAVGATDWTVGTVERLERGDALIQTGPGREAGLFVARRNLKGALDGDRVLVRKRSRQREAKGRLPEGAVLKVLAPRSPTLVGTVEAGDDDRRFLSPFDPKVPLEPELLGAEGVAEGHFVVAALERGERPEGEPAARVVRVLGDLEVPGVDTAVVLAHFRIPDEFPAEVTAAAAAFPADPGPEDWAGREDLRAAVVVTIDGESARDFDDAISVERLAGGVFRIGIHIADVAHYVREGGPLDLEAFRRGTSVYYPERAVPMLPEGLSNGLCSLRPAVPRLTLSAFLDVDRDGRILARRFAETVIRSARRLTYAEVRRVLEEPADGDAAAYGEVLPLLREARHVMEILNHARGARGSIDFDLPEGDVELGTDGTMVGILPGERNVAHRVVEEFMIAANEAVALELVSAEVPALYRVHDAPSPERLEELREVLRSLGIKLKGDLATLHPSALQEVLRRVQGHPEEPFVAALVLRTMQRARYSPECRGHYALASPYYTHFTSPIRRYPDLVVHRRLRAHLRGTAAEEAARTGLAARLPAIADHASATEKRAEQSERELLQWKKVRFLAGRTGERFPGRITGVQPFGLFVQLEGYFVDGLVPVRSLGDDYFRFEPEAHRLVGERTGRAFKLADAVEVELLGADLRHRGLDFKLVGVREPAAPGRKRGRRR